LRVPLGMMKDGAEVWRVVDQTATVDGPYAGYAKAPKLTGTTVSDAGHSCLAKEGLQFGKELGR